MEDGKGKFREKREVRDNTIRKRVISSRRITGDGVNGDLKKVGDEKEKHFEETVQHFGLTSVRKC